MLWKGLPRSGEAKPEENLTAEAELAITLDHRDALGEEVIRLRALLAYAYETPLVLIPVPPPHPDSYERHTQWRSEVGRTLSLTSEQWEAEAMERMREEDARETEQVAQELDPRKAAGL